MAFKFPPERGKEQRSMHGNNHGTPRKHRHRELKVVSEHSSEHDREENRLFVCLKVIKSPPDPAPSNRSFLSRQSARKNKQLFASIVVFVIQSNSLYILYEMFPLTLHFSEDIDTIIIFQTLTFDFDPELSTALEYLYSIW
jgi:hypothetical protein